MPAMIGVMAASAAIQGIAAHKSANASKKAAALQVASADKAQGYNQQVYNDQRQAMNPYVQAGQTSLQKLMAQHWGGDPAQYASHGAPDYQAPQPGMAQPGPMQGGPMNGQRTPMQAPGMQAPPMGGQQGGMVMMVGPDGSQKAIPQANVQAAMQRGAKVVQ